MLSHFLQILPYILSACGAGIIGGILAYFWSPRVHARSALQHFAAGVVIAAVATDLIPEIEKIGKPLGILLGFLAGGVLMIFLKSIVVKFEAKEKRRHKTPVGIALAAAVDTFMDGTIISAGFITGEQLGSLLTIALGMELFFLTLSVGGEFHKRKSKQLQGIAVTSGISILIVVGAIAGTFLFHGLSKPSLAIFLAFGAAALIYLIAEELLVESIEAEESLFSTATLFAGFASVLAMRVFSK
jgi:ZIP family zinc transporter